MKIVFVLSLLLNVNTTKLQAVIDSAHSATVVLTNTSPMIGVLAQEISYHLNSKWPGVYTSYIAASYVKFVEGAGARPVPIWIGKSQEYYENMMTKLNGYA